MNKFNSYSGDPRQIIARFASKCHTCGKPIKKGEQIIYWPNGKHAGHLKCDEADYRNSLASFEDEEHYNSQYR
jgi:hypothetical protein